ncbi:hypothetical protein ACLOJK_011124 [Asimina triloba]
MTACWRVWDPGGPNRVAAKEILQLFCKDRSRCLDVGVGVFMCEVDVSSSINTQEKYEAQGKVEPSRQMMQLPLAPWKSMSNTGRRRRLGSVIVLP